LTVDNIALPMVIMDNWSKQLQKEIFIYQIMTNNL